jgi:hypothetical protein
MKKLCNFWHRSWMILLLNFYEPPALRITLPSIAIEKRDIQQAEGHYSECRIVDYYAEWRYTQCRGANITLT